MKSKNIHFHAVIIAKFFTKRKNNHKIHNQVDHERSQSKILDM